MAFYHLDAEVRSRLINVAEVAWSVIKWGAFALAIAVMLSMIVVYAILFADFDPPEREPYCLKGAPVLWSSSCRVK